MEESIPVYTLTQVMNDLCVRFVINNPSYEHQNPSRFLFLLELAHWYYTDNWYKKLPYLPELKEFRSFIETFIISTAWPLFDMGRLDQEIYHWKQYKSKIPVVGALLLNSSMTMVIRVRSPVSPHYSFPRGKLNKGEDLRLGCIREIKEEIGINLNTSQCRPEYSFIIDGRSKANMHRTTYYVIPDISIDVVFDPKCPEEICDVKWEYIDSMDAREEEREKLKEIISKITKDKSNV
ncbi:mRNA-decapping enzyme [Entamoeba marina]